MTSFRAAEDKRTEGPIWGELYSPTITGGHIDEICRFADSNTILLAEISKAERDSEPIMRISSDRLEENYEILRQATDQDGRPFRIIRIPVADPLVAEYVPNEVIGVCFFRMLEISPL